MRRFKYESRVFSNRRRLHNLALTHRSESNSKYCHISIFTPSTYQLSLFSFSVLNFELQTISKDQQQYFIHPLSIIINFSFIFDCSNALSFAVLHRLACSRGMFLINLMFTVLVHHILWYKCKISTDYEPIWQLLRKYW